MRIKEKLFGLLTLLAIALFFSLPLKAQVNIGSQTEPQSFSILELTSSAGGLRLPQLTTNERNGLELEKLENDPIGNADLIEAVKGLVIYNKTKNCLEFWSGEEWISLCATTSKLEVNPKTVEWNHDEYGSSKAQIITVETNHTDWSFVVVQDVPYDATDKFIVSKGVDGKSIVVYPTENNSMGTYTRRIKIIVTAGSLTEEIKVSQKMKGSI